MVGVLLGGAVPVHAALPVAAEEPGVHEHVLGGDALARVLAQQTLYQTLGPRAQIVGEGEVAAPDLGEQAAVLGTVERIPGIQ